MMAFMADFKLFGHALVIERDIFLFDAVSDQLRDYPFFFVKTFQDATVILKKPQRRIRCIYVSSNYGQAECLSFIRRITALYPHIPIVLMVHKEYLKPSPEALAEIKQLSLLENVEDGKEILADSKKKFPDTETWKEIAPSPEKLNQEVMLKDADFMSVKLTEFVLTKNSFFNVFIRLGTDKFVKVLNAGDTIDKDFVEKYQGKKVEQLWLKQDEYRKYVELVERTAGELIKRKGAAAQDSLFHLGDSVVRELSKFGIDEQGLFHADRFIDHSITTIKRVRGLNPGIAQMIESLSKSEHTTANVVISSLLANALNIESIKAIKVVGGAALLHDIAFWRPGSDVPVEIESELRGDDLVLFKTHAMEGAKRLADTGQFEEVVIQAVAQHHDRRKDQSGKKLNLISEIVGISDAFCHHVLYSKDPNALEFFVNSELKTFSVQIEKVFRQIFVDPKTKSKK